MKSAVKTFRAIRLIVACVMGLAASALAAGGAPSGRPPNVLLIMTDDQGWGDIGSHGNELIDTPALDRLASQGARFERFYVSPVCAPTRASLLTGRYHLRTGVRGVTRALETMRADEVTIAEVFRANGYATGCFGKWHNGAHYPHHPNGQGFDEFFGFCGGHLNNYFDATLERNGAPVETRGYITDVLTDGAIQFIERNCERPFLCYIPFNAPHSPWQVPDRFFDKYKAKGRGLDDITACAYGMVENIDANIGRLLARLDALELADDTIVIFTTDNGPNSARYNGRMKGRKGAVDEGGVRVPLFVRWPGRIKAGATIEPIASHIDILPTLAELCGLELPPTKPLDGLSLAPLLRETHVHWPDRPIFSHWSGQEVRAEGGSVRTQRWRAVSRGWKLYDMVADPGQANDVASQYPQVVEELRKNYEEWFADVTREGFEPIPTEVGHPQSPTVVLPAHEAHLVPDDRQGISYLGRAGWANEWITNWTETAAYAYWDVDVVRGGRYELALLYSCRPDDVGAKLRVEAAGQGLEAIIDKPHDPAPLPSRDRAPDGAARYIDKVWATLELGAVDLPPGQTKLTVKALAKPGQRVIDLKAVGLHGP